MERKIILTRYAKRGFVGDEEFEKISSEYATVQDYYDNAIIKLRVAARSAAAEALRHRGI